MKKLSCLPKQGYSTAKLEYDERVMGLPKTARLAGMMAQAVVMLLILAAPSACERRAESHRPLRERVVLALDHSQLVGRLSGQEGCWTCGHRPQGRLTCARVASNGSLPALRSELLRRPEDDHSWGLWMLGWPQLAGTALGAEQRLRRLAEHPDASWEASNDFSVALLTLAERQDDPALLLEALDHARRASERSGGRPDPLFNRAAALDRLGLTDAAIEAWQDYLLIEPSSAWSHSVRRRLVDLRRSSQAAASVPTHDLGLRSRNGHLRKAVRCYWQPDYRCVEQEVALALQTSDPQARREARLLLALLSYQNVAYESALQDLEAIALEAGSGSSTWAAATRLSGLVGVAAGDYGTALSHLHRALQEGPEEDVGERVACLRTLAGVYHSLGDEKTAWKHMHQALRLADQIGPDARLSLFHAVRSALPAPESSTVRPLLDDALVELAAQLESPLQKVAAYLARAQSSATEEQAAPALADLSRARAAIARLPEPMLRQVYEGDAALIEGLALRNLDPEAALRALGEAVLLFRTTRNGWGLVRAHLLRAEVLSSVNPQKAGEEIDLAIAELERQRSSLTFKTSRSFAEQVHLAYERRLEGGVREGEDPARLLELAERAHRLALPSVGERSLPEPLPLEAQIVFFVLEEELLVWVRRDGEISMRILRTTRSELAKQASRLSQALTAREPDRALREAARPLSDLLFSGWGDALASAKSWVIVPDGPLLDVPFPLLLDPATGEWLFDARDLALLPALAFLRRPGGVDGEGVLIATGGGDRGLSLPDLPWVEPEAAAIAEIWQGSARRLPRSADREDLERAAKNAALVHLASHAISTPGSPLSSLVVLGDGRTSVLVTAQEILEMDLARVQVVVLGGCRAARGGEGRASGGLSLATAFLEAGAQAVVAPAVPVRDDVGVQIWSRFHRHLADGRAAGQALRETQRWAQHQPGLHPADWGGILLIGDPAARTFSERND